MTRESALRADVISVQRTLARMVRGRTVLIAVGAALVVWMLVALLLPDAVERSLRAGLGAALAGATAIGCAWVLSRRHGTVTLLRAALWIEEQSSAGFALVTWVEQASTTTTFSDAPSASVAFERVVAAAAAPSITRARAVLPRLARAHVRGPLLFVCGILGLLVWSLWQPNGAWHDALRGVTVAAPARRADAPIGAWRVRVTPPAYTGMPTQTLGDVASLRTLSGTRIDIDAAGASPDSVRARSLRDAVSDAESDAESDSAVPAPRVALESSDAGWHAGVAAPDGPMEVRVARRQFARLLLVEGIADSIPRVTLTTPARDSVLRRAEGQLPLTATLHDDLGLTRAAFDVVITSGEGERFTVRSVQVGARSLAGVRETTLRASLDLSAMKLGPGDIIHVRAIARDAHPAADREAGTSETRSFRIARPSEYDSIAVEPAPPPEVDKSLISQRMLLMLTEKLEARRPRLTLSVLHTEAGTLARDQARLREAVGDAVFQRLTGEGGGEHSHAPGDGHDHGVEAVGGKLALSGTNAEGMLEEGDDSPVIAINKPLLEAYNAMWDAGRSLEQSDLRAAIPFMKIALAAIERARAASRLYLRGRPPTVIIDLARVRLVGKDTGAPEARIARLALPARNAARELRLLSAAALMPRDASAARDSLAVLRLESLADAPAFAQALASVLELMSRGARADVTEPMLRARRMLGGVERIPSTGWSLGGPP